MISLRPVEMYRRGNLSFSVQSMVVCNDLLMIVNSAHYKISEAISGEVFERNPLLKLSGSFNQVKQ